MNSEGRPEGRPAVSQTDYIGGSGSPGPIISANKKNNVVETKPEGSLTLPFAPIRAALQEGSLFLGLEAKQSGVLILSEERRGTLSSKVQRWNLNGFVHSLRRQQALEKSWAGVVYEAIVYCHQKGLGVLVVDTFSEWARIGNENEAGEILAAIGALQMAADTGLAVVVVSHQRKAPGRFGEAVRGSNALTGAVDIVLELERSLSFRDANVRVLRAVSRYDETPDDLVVALTEDGYEVRGDSETAKAEEESEAILSALDGLSSATTDDLAEATELHASKVRRHASRLFGDERIGRTGCGKRNDPFVWHRDFVSTTPDSLVVERKSLFDEAEP
jgi:AAA domain